MFRTSHYQAQLEGLLKDDRSNVLVAYGDKDEFTGVSNYKGWAEQLIKAALKSNRLRIVEIQNASHFWRGHTGLELAQMLGGWLP